MKFFICSFLAGYNGFKDDCGFIYARAINLKFQQNDNICKIVV